MRGFGQRPNSLVPKQSRLPASPLQSTAYSGISGATGTTIYAGPGGFNGTPLLDLNGDGLGDMVVKYSTFSSGQPVPHIVALLSNADGTTSSYSIATFAPNTRVDQVVVAYLAVQWEQLRAAEAPGVTAGQVSSRQKRLDGAQRRFAAAVKALAVVRKLVGGAGAGARLRVFQAEGTG